MEIWRWTFVILIWLLKISSFQLINLQCTCVSSKSYTVELCCLCIHFCKICLCKTCLHKPVCTHSVLRTNLYNTQPLCSELQLYTHLQGNMSRLQANMSLIMSSRPYFKFLTQAVVCRIHKITIPLSMRFNKNNAEW